MEINYNIKIKNPTFVTLVTKADDFKEKIVTTAYVLDDDALKRLIKDNENSYNQWVGEMSVKTQVHESIFDLLVTKEKIMEVEEKGFRIITSILI